MRCLPLALALACSSPGARSTSADTGSEAPALDPDVRSYVPPGWRASNPVRLVYLGDSITAGAGASKGSLAYSSLLVEDTSSQWSDYADLDLQSRYGALEVIDVSRGGATTSSLLTQQLPALDDVVGGSALVEALLKKKKILIMPLITD